MLDGSCTAANHSEGEYTPLPFDRFICLINLRDTGVYFPTPILLKKSFFLYYLSPSQVLTFDIEDLFYYARRRIQQRGGRLFVADYGMQVTLGSRYGIRPHAVAGRDYEFLNGDELDFRYENIRILSRYHGVEVIGTPRPGQAASRSLYRVKINVKGYYTVGTYEDEITAAIAYNKAADYLISMGVNKKYRMNYIEELPASEYASIYTGISMKRLAEAFERKKTVR